MSLYKLSNFSTFIIRTTDGASVPVNAANSDYQAFLAWQAAGNTPDPVDVPTIAAQIPVINQAINDWRRRANSTTFPYSGKSIACDVLSRSDIDAVANTVSMTGALPTTFPNTWKCTDNTFVPIPDVSTFKAFYAAMVAQGDANFNKSQTFKTALAAAVTQADLNVITGQLT